jgi:hypothetical protein
MDIWCEIKDQYIMLRLLFTSPDISRSVSVCHIVMYSLLLYSLIGNLLSIFL